MIGKVKIISTPGEKYDPTLDADTGIRKQAEEEIRNRETRARQWAAWYIGTIVARYIDLFDTEYPAMRPENYGITKQEADTAMEHYKAYLDQASSTEF